MRFPRSVTLGLIVLAMSLPPVTVACVSSPPGVASVDYATVIAGQAILAGVPLTNARVVFRDGLYNGVIPTSAVSTDGEGRFLIPRTLLNKHIATYITVSDGKMAVAGIMTYDGAICRSTGKAAANAVVLDTDTSMTAAVLLTNLERLGFTNGEYHAKQGTELPQDLQRQLMDGMAVEAGKRAALGLKPGDREQAYFLGFAFQRFATPGTLDTQAAPFTTLQTADEQAARARVQRLLDRSGINDLKADHWAAPALATLVDQGIISPDASGKINPDAPISRDETASIFAKVLGVASKADTVAEAATKAEQAGIIRNRTTDATGMTNLEVALLMARTLGIEPTGPVSEYRLPYADWYNVPEEHYELLVALHQQGLLPLNADREFGPRNIISKASMAAWVSKAFAQKLAGPSYSVQKAVEAQRQPPIFVPQQDPSPPVLNRPMSAAPPSEPNPELQQKTDQETKPEPKPIPNPSAATSSAPVSSGGGGGSTTPAPTPTPTASAKVSVTITQGATSPTIEATIN